MAGTLPNRTIDISSIVPGLDGKVRPHDPLGLLGGGLRYLLDDFDYDGGEIPFVFDDGTARALWIVQAANNIVDVAPTAGILGGPCLVLNSQLYGNSKPAHATYYNNRNNAQGFGVNNWHYLSEIVDTPHSPAPMNGQGIQAPDFFKINRMRFWLKVADNVPFPAPGRLNFHFGTYCRSSGTSRVANESDNYHFYHEFAVGHTGSWHQCIVDANPHHQRTVGRPTSQSLFNLLPDRSYFDAMTWFYIQHTGQTIAVPTNYLIDHIEFYEDQNETDDDLLYWVRAVNGCRSTTTPNELIVGWSTNKSSSSNKRFDIRYSWQSMHRNGGWESGTVAPNGTGVNQLDGWDYTACRYATSDIDLSGRDVIYFGIMSQDYPSGFREIAIPLTNAGYAAMGVNA